jgi:DNA repair protein RadD
VAAVFGDTLDFERGQALADFKAGKLKYLVNVNVLSTGFDAPNIDCVAMLRPTLSPGLYYQMVGRGFRLHPGKKDCLVLDFGGNALRHGPVDALKIKDRSLGAGGEAPAKECPQCHSVIAAGYTICPDCGHEFPRERSTHDSTAGTAGVLSGQVSVTTYPVSEVLYGVHVKRGAPENAPRSMRVEYRIGFNHWQSEWICFEHSGFARQKAEQWWKRRSNLPVPNTADEAVALAESGVLCETKSITVRAVAGEEFDRIVSYELVDAPTTQPVPEYVPANDEIPF